MTILICAASGIEAKACQSGIVDSRQPEYFETLQCGVGMERAHRTLKARLQSGPRPDAIVSSGFAGSLDPTLSVGTWAWSTSVALKNNVSLVTEPPPSSILAAPLAWASSPYATVPKITTAAPSSRQARPDTGVVDMESYAWAELATEHSIPFFIIRLISDSPHQPIPESIRSWTEALVTPQSWKQCRHVLRGSLQSVSSPLELARFARRSHRLLADLSSGWRSIASLWPSATPLQDVRRN